MWSFHHPVTYLLAGQIVQTKFTSLVSSLFSCFLFLFAARVSHGRERSPAIQDWQEVGSCAAQTIVGTISRRKFFTDLYERIRFLGASAFMICSVQKRRTSPDLSILLTRSLFISLFAFSSFSFLVSIFSQIPLRSSCVGGYLAVSSDDVSRSQ